MKFTSTVLALSLACSVVATPTVESYGPAPVQRDIAAFSSIIANVQAAVKTLDSAILAYNGGAVTGIHSANEALVSTINAGVTTANSEPDLDQTDALTLTSPILDLTSTINTTITDLISKKPLIDAANAGFDILTDVKQQNSAAAALATAITSKVPSSIQSVAAQLASGINAAIAVGLNAFAGETQPTSSTTGAPSSSTTGASSSSTTSGAPPSSTTTGAPSSSTTTGAPSSSTTTGAPSSSTTTGASSSSTTTGAPSSSTTGVPYPTTTGTPASRTVSPSGTGVVPPSTSSLAPFTNAGAVNHTGGLVGFIVALAALLVL